MPLAAGSRLDSYEIVAPLGAGGMGEVYRARDATLKRDVAIKVLPEYWSRDHERLRRFEQEAQSTAALNHPNIVSIFHVGQFDGSPYIVTELLQGETLRDRLRKGPMRLREVLNYGAELVPASVHRSCQSDVDSERGFRRLWPPDPDDRNFRSERFRQPGTACLGTGLYSDAYRDPICRGSRSLADKSTPILECFISVRRESDPADRKYPLP
jgi:serine/threonine protein kinase